MSAIINYPIPKGAVLQQDFCVKLRAEGDREWQETACYQVKVDMHEVRKASMVYFDFSGTVDVEITCPALYHIYQVDIRPLSAGIKAEFTPKVIRFRLDHPQKLSVEVNGERFHNLHLFAGAIPANVPDPNGDEVLFLPGDLNKPSIHRTEEMTLQVSGMKKNRIVYFGPGIHYLEECTMRIPSDTDVYLSGGSVIVGTFILSGVENVRIYGRGCLYLARFERFSGLNAIRISHSKNVRIEGIHLINPPHYSVYIGGSEEVWIEDITTFSCEGWSDGIDMMSSRNVTVKNCFLRTSDDCIAIYGRRWDYSGNVSHIWISGCSLWADVAHPSIIGTHGDYEQEGNILEDIRFENLDILEHREHQDEYLGCLAINAGDRNMIRNITYENIRIEPFVHGKILDFQVKRNPDYNPVPGKGIHHVSVKNVSYSGCGEVPSRICGYSREFSVSDIVIQDFCIRGEMVHTLDEANILTGPYADGIEIISLS